MTKGDIFYLKKQEIVNTKSLKIGTKVYLIIWNASTALVREFDSGDLGYSFAIDFQHLSKIPINRGHPLTSIFRDEFKKIEVEEKAVKPLKLKAKPISSKPKRDIWYDKNYDNWKNLNTNYKITYSFT